MTLKKEIARANIIFTAGRIISIAISFFFSIILARTLQPYNFGLFSFCLMVAGLFSVMTDFGMGSTLIRFVANFLGKNDRKSASSVVKVVLKYRIVFTLASGALISLFSSQIAGVVFGKPEAGFVVFFSGFVLVFVSFFDFFKYLFLGVKNFGISSIMQILESAIKFGIVIGFVLLGMSISGAVSGLIITYILLDAICLIIIYKKYGFLFSGGKHSLDRKTLMNFSAWIFVGSLVNSVYGFMDQLVISALLPLEHLGFYRIAQSWMWAVIYIIPIASTVMYPYFSGSDNKNQINAVLSSSIRYSAIFVFPLALLVSAFSGPLIAVFYKESYMAAIEPMVILAFASIFAIFSMLLSSFFSGIKRPDINTKTAIISVCIYFPMTFFLTSLYGIAGAASAFLIIKAVETIILLALAGLKHGSFLLKPSAITKPVFASVIMYFSAVFLFLPHVDGYLTLGIFGILSLLIYAAVLALTGGIRKEEVLYIKRWIRWIPGVSR